MFFMIRKFDRNDSADAAPVAGDAPDIRFTWTLHRKDKNAPEHLGEAICRSVETYETERQTRAAINTAKKAMQGVRFAQTRVTGDST